MFLEKKKTLTKLIFIVDVLYRPSKEGRMVLRNLMKLGMVTNMDLENHPMTIGLVSNKYTTMMKTLTCFSILSLLLFHVNL